MLAAILAGYLGRGGALRGMVFFLGNAKLGEGVAG